MPTLVAALLTFACTTAPAAPPTETPNRPEAPADAAPTTVRGAFPPPAGAERVTGDPLGESLGALRLAPASEPVLTYDGRPTHHLARVIELPLVPGDLQQCADSALRVRAEWQRAQGLPVTMFATSGDPMPWSRWQAGERFTAAGNKLVWRGGGAKGDTDESWERYLAAAFTYAGTLSLQHYETTPTTDPRPGDVLVVGGSPGHAVLILEVAKSPDGPTWLLIGEGYMPAQSFHVELGPEDGWWRWDPVDGLRLSHWHLPGSSLRRFKR
jgi:hypothetical protein